MCGRYILIQTLEYLEKRFEARAPEGVHFVPSYNVSPGKYAPVITNEKPREIQLYRFGLTPFWSSKANLFINARAEGDYNSDNDPRFTGAKGIISKPAFRKPIRSQRCLIPADAFIEGPEKEKLSKPYLVYLRNKVRPFAFAGIWDRWNNHETGEIISSFAIITTVANELLQMIPHHRSPVILHREQEKEWLSDNLTLSEVTSMLNPYPAAMMNAYPISPAIKSPYADEPGLIDPIGDRLVPEHGLSSGREVSAEGMGHRKKRRSDPTGTLGDRMNLPE
jgi:putative SOS response-associated peptidase YedK